MWPLLPAALAAGLDADGLSLPVTDGSVSQPALSEAVPWLARRQLVLGLDAALTVAPLVRHGGEPVDLVPGAGTTYLRTMGMGTSWLGGELHFPIRWVAGADAGPAPGDLRANVILRPLATETMGLALRLGTSMPTGTVARYAGAGVFVPRGHVAARFGDRYRADVGVGLAWEGPVTLAPDQARGGATLDAGLGLGLQLDRIGIGVSGRVGLPLASQVRLRRGFGAEVGVHGGLAFTDRLGVRLLGSRALTDAAGIPLWRLAAGVTYRIGPDEQTGIGDVHGQRYLVRSPDGLPVAGAEVRFGDGTRRFTDAWGAVEHPPGRWQAQVRAKGLVPATLDGHAEELVLAWAPTPIRIEVTSDTGEPVAASVTGLELQALPGQVFVSEAMPGSHELVVQAQGFGRQTRMIELPPRRTDPLVLEVVLIEERGDGSLEMRIEDPQGRGIEAAEVRLDGLSVGTSATGRVRVEGLEQKTINVEVESPYFGDFAADVDLAEEPGELLIHPYYAPGTIRIVATGPEGPIRDGTVFLDGPRALAPLELSPLGERLIRLATGTWDILLSSPALGLQERRITLEPTSPVPVDLSFELLPEVDGSAELQIRVTDRDGRPLPSVQVQLDGVSVGRTSTEGQLRLHDLATGAVALQAQGEALRPASSTLTLHDGLQEARLTLDWEPGSVQVRASSPSGPVDARALFAGPEPYQGGNLGPGGRRLFPGVPPGEWEVVATHELGMEVALTLIEEGDPRLNDVALHLGEEVGDATLSLQVRDPLGDPIEGARVTLDDLTVAATSTGGGMRVSGLVAGQRSLRVEGPFHQTVERQVVLPAELELELPWRPGVIDLIVSHGGEALGDAEVFFDGPAPHPAVTLGSDGYARVALGPGSWTAVVSSPTAGLAEQAFELPAEAGAPEKVEVQLEGGGELLVRVLDASGEPVVGAPVRVGGEEVGTTGASGVVGVPRQGAVRIQVADPRLVELAPVDVPADWSELLVEADWARLPVPVEVVAGDTPTAAWIQAIGPAEVKAVYLGTSGHGTLELPPGKWELLASAEGYGVARQRVFIETESQAAPVLFRLSDTQLTVDTDAIRLKTVLFASGAHDIGERYASVIEEIAATVIADPRIIGLEVQGHTDDVGGPAVNFDLSRRRANAVLDALVKRGVPPDMVKARGFGQTRPIASNLTEEGRAHNRRVHFEITREDDQGGDR